MIKRIAIVTVCLALNLCNNIEARTTRGFITNSSLKYSSYHAYKMLSEDKVITAKDVRQLLRIARQNEVWAKKITKKLKLNKLSQKRKTLRIIRWICRTYTYDTTQKYVEQARKTHGANCSAYADIMYCLCKSANIPVKYIIGYNDKVCHAWNRVKVGKRWYWCDTTMADAGYDRELSRQLWDGYGGIEEEW